MSRAQQDIDGRDELWSVVIVDPFKSTCTQLEALLSNQNFKVRVLNNPESALLEIQNTPPHLVIFELLLPGMDGLDFCRHIRQQCDPNIKLLCTSSLSWGYVDLPQKLAKQFNARFLQKPFRPVEVLHQIRQVLGSSAPWSLPENPAALSPIGQDESAQTERLTQHYETGAAHGILGHRVQPRVGLHYRVGFDNVDEFIEEFTHNISAGGVFVKTDQPPVSGDLTEITLSVPFSERQLRAKARVVHVVTVDQARLSGAIAGFGAEFVDISDSDREFLREMVDDYRELCTYLESHQEKDTQPERSRAVVFVGGSFEPWLREPNFLHRKSLRLFTASGIAELKSVNIDVPVALCLVRAECLGPQPQQALQSLVQKLGGSPIIIAVGRNAVTEAVLEERLISGIWAQHVEPKDAVQLLREQLDIVERRHPRARHYTHVQVFVGSDVFSATMVNLSMGGLALRTAAPLTPSLMVKVSFGLPGLEDLSYRARVVWHMRQEDQECLTGLSFTHANMIAMEPLRRFIQSQVGFDQFLDWMEQHYFEESGVADAVAETAQEDNADRFGKFKIEGAIGRGGMAEVVRAVALKGPLAGHTVALKRLHPHLATESSVVDLFLSEADVSRNLKHPTIVPILETGVVEETYYIAMEYVEGEDLRTLMYQCHKRKISLPLDFICFVVHTVAQALQYAHTATSPSGEPMGIVHCDVSPSNIFVSVRGDIRLGDFGIAQTAILQDLDAEHLRGKEHYLAPEQIRGEQVSPATDVFALGVIFYELLTSHRPFDGKDVEDVCQSILKGKVKPPRTYRKEIPAELEHIVLRCLNSARQEEESQRNSLGALLRSVLSDGAKARYESAQALADDIAGNYDSNIGNPMAIAAVLKGLMAGS